MIARFTSIAMKLTAYPTYPTTRPKKRIAAPQKKNSRFAALEIRIIHRENTFPESAAVIRAPAAPAYEISMVSKRTK